MTESTRQNDMASFEEWVECCFGDGHRQVDRAFEAADDEAAIEDEFLAIEAQQRYYHLDGRTAAAYLRRLFLEADHWLGVHKRSAYDLSDGLWYTFGINGDFDALKLRPPDDPRGPDATNEEFAAVLDALPVLFRDVFEVRCTLEFRTEVNQGDSAERRLAGAVFMIWDMDVFIGLVNRCQPAAPDNPVTTAAIGALKRILYECSSTTCLHSALHGLNHLYESGEVASWSSPGDVRELRRQSQEVVDAFIRDRAGEVPDHVIAYAQIARVGKAR
ncbi:MAG: hypothetical protein KJZ69_09275 [Phycisphaerales bacterium]|nr:hypothetical protein [Phycisphaerales bacterium]